MVAEKSVKKIIFARTKTVLFFVFYFLVICNSANAQKYKTLIADEVPLAKYQFVQTQGFQEDR